MEYSTLEKWIIKIWCIFLFNVYFLTKEIFKKMHDIIGTFLNCTVKWRKFWTQI